MSPRKVTALILTVLMTSPAWGAAETVGSVTSSNAGMVKNTKLTPGSTLFSGDAISVGDHGAVAISLPSGAQAEILGSSSVRLTKADGKIRIGIDRGQASFRSSGNSVEAQVADATVRPANGAEARAIIQSLNETHAVIAAQKGTLLITTAFDGMAYTVREGEAAELSVAADPQQGGAAPAGRAAPAIPSPNKKIVIWTVVIVSASAAIAAYLLTRGEPDRSSTVGNEISPTKLN